MGKTALLFLVLALALPLHAQRHDYQWPLGYGPTGVGFGNMLLDFNSTPPTLHTTDLNLNFDLYCGACSDSSGALLFYTNGIAIYNFAGQLMENGDTINPGQLWQLNQDEGLPVWNGAFALPDPGQPNCYYLIHSSSHIDISPGGFQVFLSPIYYSRIDMAANGGLGNVLEKNKVLLEGDLIHITACKHGNGRDWWLMSGQKGQAVQYSFRIDPQGIHGPFTQTVGPPIAAEGVGMSLFTPDGKTYIRHNSSKGLRIYDFDRCSGQLSNLRTVAYPDSFYTWYAQASADSRLLYLNYPTFVGVLDLTADDPGASFDTLAVYDGYSCPNLATTFGLPGRGADGKLYYGAVTSTQCLSTMHHPGFPGLAADLAQHDFALPRFNDGTMCPFPNYRLGVLQGSSCDSLAATPGFSHQIYENAAPELPDRVYPLRAGKSKGQFPAEPARYYGAQRLPGQKNQATVHD